MNQSSNRSVIGLLVAWFCFALALGSSGLFQRAGAPALAATVWGLTAVILIACWKIQIVRNFAATLDLRNLIALHLVRFVGVYFLILGAQGRLPYGFARPAGIGDIIVAIGAVVFIAAPRLRGSRAVRIWNFFGFIDIIFVVFSALRFGLQDWQSMTALRTLPLSLLPTFFVPLIIASHVLIFVRLIRAAREPTGA